MIEIVDIEETKITKEQAMEAIETLQQYCEEQKDCNECYIHNGAECVARYPFLWKVVK